MRTTPLQRRMQRLALRKFAKTTAYQGIPVVIDRPAGYVMTGTNDAGEEWSRTYTTDYGFIVNPRVENGIAGSLSTDGGDGEELDVFLGPDSEQTTTFWAMQVDKTGAFDEWKVFLGFDSLDAAEACYADHIPIEYLASWQVGHTDHILALLGITPTSRRIPEEKNMGTNVNKDDLGLEPEGDGGGDQEILGIPGAGDVLALASDHLKEVASGVAPDGVLKPEQIASLHGVCSLIMTCMPQSMTEKAQGILMANYAALATKAMRETNGVVKQVLEVEAQKALDLAEAFANSAGTTAITVREYNDPAQLKPKIEPTPALQNPGAFGPSFNGGPIASSGAPPVTPAGLSDAIMAPSKVTVSAAPNDGSFALKNLSGKVAALKAKAGGEAPAPEAPVAKQSNGDPWPDGYVQNLPDSSFLFVEPDVSPQVIKAGLSYRHFPVKDAAGNVSTWHVKQAIQMLPVSGFPVAQKASLLAKAEELLAEAEKSALSKSARAARGDDGWPDDLSTPEFMRGQDVPKGPGTFGYDNLATRLAQANESGQAPRPAPAAPPTP